MSFFFSYKISSRLRSSARGSRFFFFNLPHKYADTVVFFTIYRSRIWNVEISFFYFKSFLIGRHILTDETFLFVFEKLLNIKPFYKFFLFNLFKNLFNSILYLVLFNILSFLNFIFYSLHDLIFRLFLKCDVNNSNLFIVRQNNRKSKVMTFD